MIAEAVGAVAKTQTTHTGLSDLSGVFTRIALLALVLISTLVIVNILKRIIRRKQGFVKGQWTPLKFYSQFLYGIIYFFGFLLFIYLIPPLRSLSVSLFASSGVLAIVIGFAAQNAFANIISGCFITIFKPFRIGDKVKFVGKDVSGTVEDITMRHTVVRTFENKRIIIPNSIVSVDIIENAHITEEKVCRFLEIGISYDSDMDKAIMIMRDETQKHPNFFDNRTEEEKQKQVDPVKAKVLGFGDFSVNLRAWVWAKDNATGFDMVCDLNKSIKERFDREGIEIPFPYRTLVFKDKTQIPANRENGLS
ncbi:MAG: mechanosensitive ion channel family protein [Phycisphaerae bacterium]|nr:mechanosensitive ion channel family protein [Phycisphaerae bacterium]